MRWPSEESPTYNFRVLHTYSESYRRGIDPSLIPMSCTSAIRDMRRGIDRSLIPMSCTSAIRDMRQGIDRSLIPPQPLGTRGRALTVVSFPCPVPQPLRT